MCGIVGVLRFGDLSKQTTLSSAIYLGTNLLEITEERGKDATGITAVFDNGMFYGQKMGINAKKFIASFGKTETDFNGFLTILREYKEAELRTIIGHCRKKSVGEAYNNINNHPIIVDNIIGVHNGTLTNHNEIFKNLTCKREGDVDSEAIFRLLQHFTDNGKEPFTLDILNEVTKRLSGAFGVIAINADNPTKVAVLRDARPIEFCLIKPLNMVLIGSEVKFFDELLYDYNKMGALFNYPDFITIKNSDIELSTLQDNHYGIFDLTKTIDTFTKLNDLIDIQKSEPILNKIWKPVVEEKGIYSKTTNYVAPFKNETIYNKTVAVPQITTTKETPKINSIKNTGKLWNPKLGKYVEIDTVVENNNTSVINLETNKLLTLEQVVTENLSHKENENKIEPSLHKITKNAEQFNWVNDQIVVNRVMITDSSDIIDVNYDSHTIDTNLLTEIKKQSFEGKDLSKNEKDARIAANKAIMGIKKFSTDEEVALESEVELSNLKLLTLPALINRLFKSFFHDSFIKGWLAKCESIETKENDELLTKINSAKKNIHVLKKFTSIFSKSINELDDKTKIEITNKIHNNIKGNAIISKDRLLKVFNAGDLKTDETLCNIIKMSNK